MTLSSRVWLILTVIYIVLTFVASGISDFSFLTKLTGNLLRMPEDSDILLHMIEYGVLAWFLLSYRSASGILEPWFRTVAVTILICALVGGLNELLQSKIPGRYPSIVDEIANILGSAVTVVWFRLKLK